MSDTIKLIEDLGKEFAEFKTIHSNELNELKTTQTVSAETKAQMESVNGKLDAIEAKLREANSGSKVIEQDNESMKAFAKFLRKGDAHLTEKEIKALSTDSNSDGGYLVPLNYGSQIIEKITEISPVRQFARVIPISVGDAWTEPVENALPSAAWVGEHVQNGDSSAGTFTNLTIYTHEMNAEPYVTEKMLQSNAYNVEEYLQRKVVTAFNKLEGTSFISGSGVGQPQGILTNTSVATIASGSATSFDADDLMEMFYGLKSDYARNGAWMVNRVTLGFVRKLKAGDDNYLWQPGLAGSAPATILGRPYAETTDLVAPTAGAFVDGNKPVIFGDFMRGYYIVDNMNLRVLRDPYSNKPYITYDFRKSVGGAVAQAEAMVILRTAVS